MQRILEPGQIEAFAQRGIPRLRLPERARVFSARAERLRQLGTRGAIGESIGDYLRLIADIADAQQVALEICNATPPTAEQVTHAHTFRMPPLHVSGWARENRWHRVLEHMCDSVTVLPSVPAGVRDVCDRLRRLPGERLEAQADALLAARIEVVDVAAAPFVMAALQVYWADLASRVTAESIAELDVRGVCPLCGTPPVASVVRAEAQHQGLRYLHCALCATEWHMVRVTCSHCLSTKGISYQSIEGATDAIRAECCDSCRTYRKIVYQEQDSDVEPVADDLASLPLDLLLSEAGYHRASGNPLLWLRV